MAGKSNKPHASAVPHWKWQRLSAIVTLPLMVYCVYLLGGLATLDYEAARQLVAAPTTSLPLAVLIGVGIYHAALGVQVIIEDYVPLASGRNGLIMVARVALGGIALVSLIALARITF
ncbi:MAG: succinate dehydrogenase, hydrophobic membrane anchor protein [Candidatus Puniceispirillaceae bacterium]